MDNKKSGIRLRHLEQKQEPELKRDHSPSNLNRKKIFQRVMAPTPPYEKILTDDLINQMHLPWQNHHQFSNSQEYEQLVETLKRKSMEVEQKDDHIKKMKMQLQAMQIELESYRNENYHLKIEIEKYVRGNRPEKDPHKKSSNREQSSISYYSSLSQHSKEKLNMPEVPNELISNNSLSNALKKNMKKQSKEEEFTLMNINMPNNRSNNNSFNTDNRKQHSNANHSQQIYYLQSSSRQELQESFTDHQIVSPFMALANHHPSQLQPKVNSTFQQPERFAKKETQNSQINYVGGFQDSRLQSNSNQLQMQNPFENQYYKKQQPTNKELFNKSLAKTAQNFDIFGTNREKGKDIRQNKLLIEDSRQYKFEDFNEDDFQPVGFDTVF